MNKTHYMVYDSRTNLSVSSTSLPYSVLPIAQEVAQRLNRQSRAKAPRYVIVRVDPDNLPLYGTSINPGDIVPEFA